MAAMLGMLDSPIAMIFVFVVVLICFGPNKVPEIASQLGRAIGEFKRATANFQQTVNTDVFDPANSYKPTSYDSYGNPSDYSSSSDDYHDYHAETSQPELASAPAEEEAPRGDFAAAAFSDDQYGAG